MQRTLAASTGAVALILTLGVTVADNASARVRPAHAAGHATSVTACGVERWAVKTGIDPDARLVNQKAAVPTTIVHMRSLPAPAFLPARSRLRPVETTVWAVHAILLRYHIEQDSDVHLVLADTGGRTVVAEIPAPACVGSTSPYLDPCRSATLRHGRMRSVQGGPMSCEAPCTPPKTMLGTGSKQYTALAMA